MTHDLTFLDTTRDMLEKERTAILARMQTISRDSMAFEMESDGIPPSGFEREGAIAAVLESRLTDIDNALARLVTGTYGTCADCSKPIPPRRLEALPFATLCVSCQSVADKRGVRRVAVR